MQVMISLIFPAWKPLRNPEDLLCVLRMPFLRLKLADYVSGYNAGDGAVRDCINYIIQRNSSDVNKRVNDVIRFILKEAYKSMSKELLPEGSIYIIQEYTTKEESECVLETH